LRRCRLAGGGSRRQVFRSWLPLVSDLFRSANRSGPTCESSPPRTYQHPLSFGELVTGSMMQFTGLSRIRPDCRARLARALARQSWVAAERQNQHFIMQILPLRSVCDPVRCGSVRGSLCAPFIVSMHPPDYPSARLRPRSAASVSPGRIIVTLPRPARPTSGCAVI
jgi:hypothetical protein